MTIFLKDLYLCREPSFSHDTPPPPPHTEPILYQREMNYGVLLSPRYYLLSSFSTDNITALLSAEHLPASSQVIRLTWRERRNKEILPQCKDDSIKYEIISSSYRNGLSCRDAQIEVWPLKNTEMKVNVVVGACETVCQLNRGRILERNWDKSIKSFPPCYSQSPILYGFYVPETHIMYFIRRCWFLKCSEEIHYVPIGDDDMSYYVPVDDGWEEVLGRNGYITSQYFSPNAKDWIASSGNRTRAARVAGEHST